MTRTSITILMENHAEEGLACEHGLSFYIVAPNKKILFDAGQSDALMGNAAALNVPIQTIDTLVVSHGHYDHTGGMPQVLAAAPTVQIYAHPQIKKKRYSVREDESKYIGMSDEAKQALGTVDPSQIYLIEAPTELGDGIGLTGRVPRRTDYEDTGGPFYLDTSKTTPDLLEDDMAMWIETKQGLVVILGCAHSGVVNTLTYICKITGTSKVHAVIGGFHLVNAASNRMDQTITAFEQFEPNLLVPCHCTGPMFTAQLKRHFNERVCVGYAGMRLEF